MTNEEKIEFCFDNSVRIEQIIHLATMCYDESFNDATEEAFSDDAAQIWEVIGIEPPEDMLTEYIAEHLTDNNKHGFLVKWATPVPKFIGDGDSCSFSWGYYTTGWVYADSYDEAFNKCKDDATEYYDKKREKYLKQCAL